jgi:hypothetical protein
MKYSNICYSDLSFARGLNNKQVDEAWGNFETNIPHTIDRPVNERWLTDKGPGETDDAYSKRLRNHATAWLAHREKIRTMRTQT